MKKSDKNQVIVEDDRTGIEKETLKRAFLDNLYILLRHLLPNFPMHHETTIAIQKAA